MVKCVWLPLVVGPSNNTMIIGAGSGPCLHISIWGLSAAHAELDAYSMKEIAPQDQALSFKDARHAAV
jgi:hypothetical protein